MSPTVGITAALLVGIVAAPFVPIVPLLAAIFGGVLLAVTALVLIRSPLFYLPVFLLFGLFGTVSAQRRSNPAKNDVSRLASAPSGYLLGTVADEPESTATGAVRYPLRVLATDSGADVAGTVAVTQMADAGDVPRFGDTVRVRGRVVLPHTATNPGGFDYRAYLRRRGIFGSLAAKRSGDAVIEARARPSWRGAAFATRRALLASLARSPLPDDDKALVSGVLLSERGRIPYADELALERSGAVHLLAVSGLHLAVFAALITWATRRLPAHRLLRNAGNLLAIALLWTYAMAAGFSAATVRSAVMLTVLMLAPVFRRDANPLHSLVVAAFFILLFDPLAVYDTGAAFSFACVGGLLLWMTTLGNWLFPMERDLPRLALWGRGLLFVFCTGFVAQVAAVPLTAYHFSLVSLIAPVSGMVCVPLSELLLLIGLTTAGTGAACPLPAFLWQPLHYLCALLMFAVRGFAAPPLAAVSVPQPSGWVVGVFYAAFAGSSFLFRKLVTRRTFFPQSKPRLTVPQLAMFPVFALIVLPLLVIVPPIIALRTAPKRLRVTFLDVGQGDAAIIETPDGAVAVIDGGGIPGRNERFGGEPGSRVVVPYLRRRGVNRVALLAPSHPDEDHVQGLIAVAHAFPVDTVLDGGIPDTANGANRRLRELLRKKKVPTVLARRGQVFTLGASGVTIEVLHPAASPLTHSRSLTNAGSEVLRVRYGSAAILFTGDAEEAAEKSLLESGVSLRADVLKVGHHGSRYSSGMAFVRAVRPSVAVVSCGAGNNFGHPAPNALENLSAVGANIYRTDRAGAVVIETDGERVFALPTVSAP